VANITDLLERLLVRKITPSMSLTDQTSAHDPLVSATSPSAMTLERPRQAPQAPTRRTTRSSRLASWPPRKGDARAAEARRKTFDYGNNLRQHAFDQGVKRAFDFPGFVPAYIRPQFCLGRGPFRWVALSGDPPTSSPPTARSWSSSPRTRASTAG
jgi:urocanate hydratase